MYKKYILLYAGLMAADKQVQSGEARRDFSALLDEVEHHDVHVKVRRYTIPPPSGAARLVRPRRTGARGQRRARPAARVTGRAALGAANTQGRPLITLRVHGRRSIENSSR